MVSMGIRRYKFVRKRALATQSFRVKIRVKKGSENYNET